MCCSTSARRINPRSEYGAPQYFLPLETIDKWRTRALPVPVDGKRRRSRFRLYIHLVEFVEFQRFCTNHRLRPRIRHGVEERDRVCLGTLLYELRRPGPARLGTALDGTLPMPRLSLDNMAKRRQAIAEISATLYRVASAAARK